MNALILRGLVPAWRHGGGAAVPRCCAKTRAYGATGGAAVTFPDLASVPATLQNIMEEKYVALYLNPEVWSDWKRTCLPSLATAPSPGGTTTAEFRFRPAALRADRDQCQPEHANDQLGWGHGHFDQHKSRPAGRMSGAELHELVPAGELTSPWTDIYRGRRSRKGPALTHFRRGRMRSPPTVGLGRWSAGRLLHLPPPPCG